MAMFARLAAALAVLAGVLTAPSPSHAAPRFVPLSSADKRVAFHASHLALGHPLRAYRWLQREPSVAKAALGLDHQTVEIGFVDGASVVLVPQSTRALPGAPSIHVAPHARSADGSAPKAVVLEPFADDLGLSTTAGQNVANLLTGAGFNVTILRNDQVTVPVMENLSQYNVVYMLTHSGVLDNGHAMVLLGETDQHPYASLFKECDSEQPPLCSVMQGIGQGETKLSVAVTDLFVQRHMSAFPNSSLVFLNGCEILSAPAYVQAWHQKNVASLIGWDGKVDSAITELSAQLLFQDLVNGSSVTQSLQDVSAKGFGTSVWDNQVTYLKQDGFGDLTLAATEAAAPLPQPTANPTDTPTARPTAKPKPTATKKPSCPAHSKKKKGKCTCTKGYAMKKGKCVKKKTH